MILLTMSSSAQDFPHDPVPPGCVSVLWLRDVPCFRSTAAYQELWLHWWAWLQLHSSWLFFVLCLARHNDCLLLVPPSALWHSEGMGRVCSSRAQAVLSVPVHFSVCFSHLPTRLFHMSLLLSYQIPVILVRIPAGTDVVVFVLFTTVSNSAFDCIIFWEYSLLTSLFTWGWKLS